MNYLKIDGKRYNLTDDGINPSTLDMILVIIKDNYSFDDVFNAFHNVGDEIAIYDTVINTDADGDHEQEFISGTFVGYTHLCSVEYNADNLTYAVKLSVPDETENRLKALENKKPLVIDIPTVNGNTTTHLDSRILSSMTVVKVEDYNSGLEVHNVTVNVIDGGVVISNISSQITLTITLI